jgi:hypothetical protein
MTDKYHSDTQEIIETIAYNPGLQDSGDLEAGTKTITATSKPSTPDYTVNLTTPNVSDARLIVRKLCQRLNIFINSFSGATKLNYSVEVNGVEHVSGEFTGTGINNPVSWNLVEGQFNLGIANTIEVFLWVDAGSAVINTCQLWQSVGSNSAYDWQSTGNVLVMKQPGFISAGCTLRILGTGSPTFAMYPMESDAQLSGHRLVSRSGDYSRIAPDSLSLVRELNVRTQSTVTTDIAYVTELLFILRSLQ